MDIKDRVFENIIAKTENVAKLMGELLDKEQAQLDKMKVDIDKNQEKISLELLNLASEMNKNKLSSYAGRIESSVVQYLLKAPYDAKKAFTNHRALFAERHTMAMFLYDHLDEIKQRVYERIRYTKPVPSKKIKVFTYWDNDDKMPPMVVLCRESLKRHISTDKFDLIILNSESYKEWTDFRKEDVKADITQAHFTDILRSKLLEQWGGYWVDATDMLTFDFYQATKQIRQQDFFVFTYTGSRVGTWFMYSKPNSYIISMISESLLLWWSKRHYLTNYFMIHDIIEMLYWVDVDYRHKWDDMLKIHPQKALAILRNYNQILNQQDFENLVKDSFIHKLTYKYDSTKTIEYSVLDKVLDGQANGILYDHHDFNPSFVRNKSFIFSRKDGSHARQMLLDESGEIRNINNNGHFNECFWAIDRGLLVFKNANHNITSMFYEMRNDDGKICIYGYFKTNQKLDFKLTEM